MKRLLFPLLLLALPALAAGQPSRPPEKGPDGIQFFEVHPAAKKILFVRVGQDIPLFDEQTLRLLP